MKNHTFGGFGTGFSFTLFLHVVFLPRLEIGLLHTCYLYNKSARGILMMSSSVSVNFHLSDTSSAKLTRRALYRRSTAGLRRPRTARSTLALRRYCERAPCSAPERVVWGKIIMPLLAFGSRGYHFSVRLRVILSVAR